MKTFEELVQEIKVNLTYHKTDKEIAKYLLDNNAITKTGAINAEYPMLTIRKNNEERTEDYSGNLLVLEEKRKEAAKSTHASIEYFPRFYSAFLEARRQLDFKI